ncbi:Asp-tRNA(Asn)/Glu-tRNA(Gln) amidotransferase GatCAB subunit C [Sporanaerobium hydrogeniformans]|uniref:Asp-tRNA(Asn)/Glu-tRNA(Gln) amidotransferase GatCAB subunit C n=1 Tax=Sporanaerobium hydrogeniformans TaxID=3072179 RepID=A0AC61DDB0_9FIRM|nr:Asp-tRNA(Asn)/Glu-tRNA(Gln) amidotransferase subunit GatC [Sporanaerobium hydrogeniformans]PHV70582.1 Asp-tRNA(Asn)/Glu-tRNA(Gln) amidotransferase GatCAB subunit C [Sporanaerobium hydrogeniformans]
MLDTALITYLAELSKIEVEEASRPKLVAEMSAIVELMDTMNDLILEEDFQKVGEGVHLNNLRTDVCKASYEREKLLQNALYKKDGFFVVPKIME